MSFIGLGVALSVVFGFLLLALVAELCYLLLWKNRTNNNNSSQIHKDLEKGVLYGGSVCCSNNNSVTVVVASEEEQQEHEEEKKNNDVEAADLDVVLKNNNCVNGVVEESVELELMRLHNLAGPPRFLFTIKEETKEDLESEDGKSRCGDGGRSSRRGSRTRSLSDLMVAIDTPFLNSLVSSPLRTSLENLEGFNNPLFESSSSSSLCSSPDFTSRFIRPSSSPPPKFKFLRDAEEKLYRRLMEEAQRKAQQHKNQNQNQNLNQNHVVEETAEVKVVKESTNSTTIITTEDKDRYLLSVINNNNRFPSSSSQILPLESSPTTLRPVDKPSMVH